jgi:hypothetical protein
MQLQPSHHTLLALLLPTPTPLLQHVALEHMPLFAKGALLEHNVL